MLMLSFTMQLWIHPLVCLLVISYWIWLSCRLRFSSSWSSCQTSFSPLCNCVLPHQSNEKTGQYHQLRLPWNIYQSANLVLFWLSAKFRWLSKSFKSSDPFRPVICVGEVELLLGWDLVCGHRIPLLTPCKVRNSIITTTTTTQQLFLKQNAPIYILNKIMNIIIQSTKCKV